MDKKKIIKLHSNLLLFIGLFSGMYFGTFLSARFEIVEELNSIFLIIASILLIVASQKFGKKFKLVNIIHSMRFLRISICMNSFILSKPESSYDHFRKHIGIN